MYQPTVLDIKEFETDKLDFSKKLVDTLKSEGVAAIRCLDYGVINRLFEKAVKVFDYASSRYDIDHHWKYFSHEINCGTRKWIALQPVDGEWPTDKDVPGFRPIAAEVYKTLGEVSAKLIKTMGDELGRSMERLPYTGNDQFLTVLEYPQIEAPKGHEIFKDHLDPATTLHTIATDNGLEILVNNKHMPVDLNQDCVLLVPGLRLEAVTDSEIKAVLHRVVIPEDGRTNTRYSSFFTFMN